MMTSDKQNWYFLDFVSYTAALASETAFLLQRSDCERKEWVALWTRCLMFSYGPPGVFTIFVLKCQSMNLDYREMK
ncbi:hypothetical protein STEG23_018518, partial [Scotinomys teguina]